MSAWLLLVVLALSAPAYAEPPRDPAQVRAFRKTHPCPHTGLTTGPCHGYVVDHVYPLCAGGADHPRNMMWQEYQSSLAKDRLERELCQCKAHR